MDKKSTETVNPSNAKTNKSTVQAKKKDSTVELKSELRRLDALLAATDERIHMLNKKRDQLIHQKEEIRNKIAEQSAEKLASVNWNRTDHLWSKNLEETLRSVFKIEKLRDLQLSTINAIMSKQDVILVMPTGGGKSLCYQLPALLLPGVTLVISPLIALMEDQVMALKRLGVAADALYVNKSKNELAEIEKQMVTNDAQLKILYVSPEKLSKSKRFMGRLEKMYQMNRLSLVAIDEVHCCSQWGHDFRPDYKFLNILRRQFPLTPILGVTATAPTKVVTDTQQLLRLDGSMVLRAPLNRPNLKYQVVPKSNNYQEVVNNLAKLIKIRFDSKDSGIIYCFSIKECEDISNDLNNLKIRTKTYHAQLDPQYRKKVHTQWLEEKIQVVVATIAFGMGIDKPNVRFVIHHSLSKSMENFYQESGRAGRDGKPAQCILMYRFGDIFRQSTMVFTERTGLENLYAMVNYCNNNSRCRRELIAEHFGEHWDPSDCKEMCDNCSQENRMICEEADVTNVCKLIYDIISRATELEERLTPQKLLDAMQGKGPPRYRAGKSSYVPLSSDICQSIIVMLLLEGYLKEEFHFTSYTTISYLNIGPKSEWVLRSRGNILLNLPTKKRKAPPSTLHSEENKATCSTRIPVNVKLDNYEMIAVSSEEEDGDDPTHILIGHDFGRLK